jgi:hypothetical protein
MKRFNTKFCLAATCLIVALSCSKDEINVVENAAVSDVSTPYPLTIPPIPGYTPEPGIEPGQPLSVPHPSPPAVDFTSSSADATSNGEYLKRTCVFEVAQLDEGKTYHQINNKNLNIAFFNPDIDDKPIKVRRLKPTTPSPYGWTAHWNDLSRVENEHPEVLFLDEFLKSFIIVLSKPCIEVGVELSPNRQNVPYIFNISAGDAPYSKVRGDYNFFFHTPSGAQLFNIQAEKPFNVVTIGVYSKKLIQPHNGISMANIRYKLAE